jgi:acetate---CoA ligase (ADP-forming)
MPPEITAERLTSLFRPRSVALVGAANKSAFSSIAYHNLARFGFADRTYLVNRRGAETHGRATVTSCQQIGEPVDVAYLMVPQAGMVEALEDAAAAGIRNAVVLSSGYGEAGPAGRAAQDDLVACAGSLGMVLLGPNHLGFANFVDRTPVCSVPGLPDRAGPVALLSQSGASSSAMLDFAGMVNVGLSYMVTLGNEAMITAGHVVDFLADDPHTRAFAIFMETVRDAEVFRRAAVRAAGAGKALVVLKAGSSVLSARTAAAHTGALVGDDRIIDAVFADLGVIRVDSIEDMLITAGAAAALGRLERSGIGIVSISGGACDIVADRAEDLGAALPELAGPTRAALGLIMPDYGTVQNPLDVTGAAVIDPSIFTRAIEAMSADPSVGVVGVINSLPWQDTGRPYAGRMFVDAIGAGMAAAACPTAYINQVMQPVTAYTQEIMEQGNVPYVIPGLRQAIVALRNVGWWSDVTRAPRPAAAAAARVAVPAAATRRGRWSEDAARRRPRRPGGRQGRLAGHPAQERHRRRQARRRRRRGRHPGRLPGRHRRGVRGGRRPRGGGPGQPDARRRYRAAGRRRAGPAVGPGAGPRVRRRVRRGAARLGANAAAGHPGPGPGAAAAPARRRVAAGRPGHPPGRPGRPGRSGGASRGPGPGPRR